jgi:hypothetical protein
MEHIGPLVETVLWVALVAGLAVRFHRPIDGILTALQKRIEAGSNVKAGPFELSALQPLDASKQIERSAKEVQDIMQSDQDGESSQRQVTVSTPSELRANHLQAEDLVLRAIQAEYGATISRQVTAGRDVGFDGVFVSSGRLNIVEVKYVKSAKALPRIRSTLETLVETTRRDGWQNVQIILAVVFDTPEQVTGSEPRLHELLSGLSVQVVVRSFVLPDLQRRFGLIGSYAGNSTTA